MTMSMHKALARQWEKCLPLPVAASLVCQHFGAWKPATKGDFSDLMNMEGIKNV